MYRIILIIVSFIISLNSFSQLVFTDFFDDGVIRYDFELVGNANEVTAVHKQTKFIDNWGGNPNCLIEKLDYGTLQFQVFDIRSNLLIFQKGLSPIFCEWLTTVEADVKQRAFYHALFFPLPKEDVTVVIQLRDKQNKWKNIFTDTIYMDDYFIIDENSSHFDVDTIRYSGDPSTKIDLILLSEGYQSDEFDKFISDSKRLADSLFSTEPFKTNRDRFNVLAVKVPSVDSGTDVPGEHIYKNTPFNTQFYTFDSPRYLTTSDMKSVYDAVDGFSWDQIYLVVNEKRYGGGGFYNFLNICSSDNERSSFVFCHEFGHGFAGLGDEYYTSDTSYDEFHNLKNEPHEPNLTTLVNSDSKWKALIEDETPVPTPRDSMYLDCVGVFEGGGYQAKGIYSPAMNCWMKSHTAKGFCPVCRHAIEKVILLQSE